jgi:hypothetical protein
MDLDDTSSKLDSLEGQATLPPPTVATETTANDLHDEMLRGVRYWGTSSIVLGVVHLIGSGFLNAPWGIILILIGLASFLWRTGSMYVIYAAVLAWAAVSNLLTGKTLWIGFAIVQAGIVFRIVQQYRHFRRAGLVGPTTASLDLPDHGADSAARVFPWLGCLISAVALAAFVLLFGFFLVSAFLSGGTGNVPWEQGLLFALNLLLNVGALGAAVALAALLSGYRLRGFSVVGLVAGLILVILNVAIVLLA